MHSRLLPMCQSIFDVSGAAIAFLGLTGRGLVWLKDWYVVVSLGIDIHSRYDTWLVYAWTTRMISQLKQSKKAFRLHQPTAARFGVTRTNA